MDRSWLLIIFITAFTLLTLLRMETNRSLATFYASERVIRLNHFQEARSRVKKENLDHLKLWESMLTGRAAPLSKWMKERYALLGLNHIFTPSGFHLSAVLFPFMKFFKEKKYQLYLLLLIGFLLLFLPGLGALKRMLLIKTHQNVFGLKTGFFMALLLDMLIGSFQTSTLSFTYSFLFLGIIYSGAQGFSLVILFFVGQIFLALFQNNDISLLILLFSPFLNMVFGLLMPLLLLLSFPLWDWQLHGGIFLLKIVQSIVDVCAKGTALLPFVEVNIVTILLLLLLFKGKRMAFLVIFSFFASSLNQDFSRVPARGRFDFVPQGKILQTRYNEKQILVNFTDGSCRLKLVRGFWWENCSPRKSRRNSRKKKIKKLSYPS